MACARHVPQLALSQTACAVTACAPRHLFSCLDKGLGEPSKLGLGLSVAAIGMSGPFQSMSS